MLVFGMALGSLGGLDTALREHFAGYRSHTTLIAGAAGRDVAALLFFARRAVARADRRRAFAVVFWWMRGSSCAPRRARRARG